MDDLYDLLSFQKDPLENFSPHQRILVDSPVGELERELASQALMNNTSAPLIMGVDEAGRGPWAGPVVAAAVIFPAHFGVLSGIVEGEEDLLEHLDDSKKLTERRRQSLIQPIYDLALGVGVGISSPALIDEINIAQANYAAMRTAIAKARREASVQESILLIDGKHTVPEFKARQRAVIKGDGRSFHIAAASVIAKVVRDKIMIDADRQYPVYGFAQHKGYGTKVHREALKEYGPCELHRLTYRPIKELIKP